MALAAGASEAYAVGEKAFAPCWAPAAGTVLFQGMIVTRAIPWKAPRVNMEGKAPLSRQSKDYQAWKRWSGGIQILLMAMYGGKPHEGPVDLDMVFVLEPKGSPPDRLNLGKGTEDLLQGIVIVNDRQVIGGDVRRVWLGTEVNPWTPLRRYWAGPERFHVRVTSRS